MTLTPEPSLEPPTYIGPLLRLAWFYKPPREAEWRQVAQRFDTFILTHNDEDARDAMKAAGAAAPFLQYLRFEVIHDPGGCDQEPLGSQVAYRVGDFCQLSAQHPDWFLLGADGKPLRDAGDGDVYMDPASAGWRAFWLERARTLQTTYGWDGLFLDNVEASLAKRIRRNQLPQQYPTDAAYRDAIAAFLADLDAHAPHPLYANIIEATDEATWFRYLQYLDGAMIEAFAVDWNDYFSAAQWEAQMALVEQAQALDKQLILVAQGDQTDAARQTFALASYLLVNSGRAAFRYADGNYEQVWLYDNYQVDLGEPLGPRYKTGAVWQRDFERGTVEVNPETHAADIVVR